MSGISEFLKKDISFKRKPSSDAPSPKARSKAPKAEAPSPKTEAATVTQEKETTKSPKRSLSLPKRAAKQKKVLSASSGGRHKQIVGLSIGASQLTAAVVVNNGRPRLVKAASRAASSS